MIFFEKKDVLGHVIARSPDYSVGDNLHEKRIRGSSGDLTIVIEDVDIARSSRLFGKLGKLSFEIFDSIFEFFQKIYLAESHSLKKIHGQLIQKIDAVVDNPLSDKQLSYEEQRLAITSQVQDNPGQTADTLMFLQKRIFEIGAHLSSFELLYLGKQVYIDKKPHNLRRLLLNVWHGLDEKFKEKGIRYKFNFEDGISDQHKCRVDYKTINTAFYNLFDNAVKYCMPETEIRFYFEVNNHDYVLKISMLSLPIDVDELPKLCSLGYRGRNCGSIDGNGIGLYIVKKALNLNGLSFEVNSDLDTKRQLLGITYCVNTFSISGDL